MNGTTDLSDRVEVGLANSEFQEMKKIILKKLDGVDQRELNRRPYASPWTAC